MIDALVIGAGPAGLMAAEMLAKAGRKVVIADAMPSIGRKFLMAGKSGLNLTKDEDFDTFIKAYGDVPLAMKTALTEFGPTEVTAWAQELGQPVFTGSSGRIFPKSMKASPLLRAWMLRLAELGVEVRNRWNWQGWDGDAMCFDTPDGLKTVRPKVTVLALGGASWSRLGSTGRWAEKLENQVAPFAPANIGFLINWSSHMNRHFGAPVKGVALHCGDQIVRGEFVISERGIEGGGIYSVARKMRDGSQLAVDLLPDWSLDKIRTALAKPRGKATLSNHLRKVLRLSPSKIALLMEFARPLPSDHASIIKSLPIIHNGPRPIDEAISTSGGLRFDALDGKLMLKERPGVFCAGEMLDWEAPTGGYLINGCLATGRFAGRFAAAYS